MLSQRDAVFKCVPVVSNYYSKVLENWVERPLRALNLYSAVQGEHFHIPMKIFNTRVVEVGVEIVSGSVAKGRLV